MKIKLSKELSLLLVNQIVLIFMLLVAFIYDIPILILATFIYICLLLLFSKIDNAFYYIAFITSFSGILVYSGKHLYFVIVALLILRTILSERFPQKTIVYYCFILTYCLAFADHNSEMTFADTIGLVLLFAIPVVTYNFNNINYRKFMFFYIFGFIISTVIGFYVMNIPAMIKLFSYDLFWTSDFIELTRFFGLAFDSNFYAFSNYLIIAYLLFTYEHLTTKRILLIIFLTLVGLQTVSKSYFIVLIILLLLYLLKNAKDIKKCIFLITCIIFGGIIFVYVSDQLGYNVVDLILSRFVKGASFAENTTGRVDIWKKYFEMFRVSGIKELLFGFGINSNGELAAHNTFIEFLYHFGIVGIVMWIMYFLHCFNLTKKDYNLSDNAKVNKTYVVLFTLLLGIFFLSAYTYESFWISIVIAMLTLKRFELKKGKIYV